MIPFNRPYFAPGTLGNLEKSVSMGMSKGDGYFTEKCLAPISRLSGGGEILLTSSCTHALEMSTLLLGLKPGDEVVMPSYTFTSGATALVHFGIVPVFIDIDFTTKNLDTELIRDAITHKTKAISFVNYAGVGADFFALRQLADEYGLFLIEDNAHGLGAIRDGQILGSIGDVATLSFHESKNIQCGEGGALVINKPELLEHARIIREKGTNRSKFLSGEVQKYEWIDKGSSYLLSDLLAGILLPQLDSFETIHEDRLETWNYYQSSLSGWAENTGVRLQHIPDGAQHRAHMFYLESPDSKSRENIMTVLKSHEINSVFHYQSLHKSPGGKKYARTSGELPITERVVATILRIPLYFGMSSREREKVVEVITEIRL